MNESISALIRERGVFLQKELYDLFTQFNDVTLARQFLDGLERASGQKLITTASLTKHIEVVGGAVNTLPGEMRQLAETTLVKMGITIEIQRIASVEPQRDSTEISYQIFFSGSKNTKKIEVADFVGHFRSRYHQIQRLLMQRPDIQNLVSINKIGRDRQRFAVIGIVCEKRITKNKNLIITFEDLTGRTKGIVKRGHECFTKAAELQLDDVVALKVSGNNELLMIQDIIFPDAFKEKVRFNREAYVAFVSDVHAGSAKHLGNQFERFIDWLNTDTQTAPLIKFIFFVGDNVDGVGVFPGQERLLAVKDLKSQYNLLASYLKRVPQHITMFMCPGQHDSVHVAEPQPVIDNIYGEALYGVRNLILVSNPALIKLIEEDKEFLVQMYHGASIHHFINEIEELRLAKAHQCPARAVRHMLKRRHLAPTHGVTPSIVYVPNSQHDPMVIQDVPDVLCTGEVHRLDIETYNGVLIITGSCWQSQTEFEEKVGNVPDPCKVPILNLKTRELKILDFTDGLE
ncbi:MAG TPA: metallophosphoesterase [Candidatus Nanoarchaeia archaeon]|nr:metallophosphoesterase [Candidatus Nanoarchaeia archaeon]